MAARQASLSIPPLRKKQYLLLVIHALKKSRTTLKGEKTRVFVPEGSVDNVVFEGYFKNRLTEV